MYSFARRPLWILSHLIVIAIAVLFINLGFWQLRRHDERAEQNANVVARSEQEAVSVQELLAEGRSPEDLRYRRVEVTGTYLAGAHILIDNRSHEGRPGAWVVTPMVLEDGGTVAVSRGFIHFQSGELDPPDAPNGRVSLEATAVEWDSDCGIRTSSDGRPVGAACLNQEAVEAAADAFVLPIVLQRVASTPTDDPALVPVPLPELDAGPHRSYAVQWFLFCAIGLITYPLILRRVARSKAAEAADDHEAPVAVNPDGRPRARTP